MEGVDSSNTDSSDWSDGSMSDLDSTVHMGYYKRGPSHTVSNKRVPMSMRSGKNNIGRIPDPTYTVKIPASTKVSSCFVLGAEGVQLQETRVGGCGQLPVDFLLTLSLLVFFSLSNSFSE
jgi:hypothetical protein